MAIEEGETEADIRPLKAELKKAEMELKRSKTKDYYKILALRRDCSGGDIKKAYRVASLRHHPDKVRLRCSKKSCSRLERLTACVGRR